MADDNVNDSDESSPPPSEEEQAKIQQFCSRTGTDEATAFTFLEAHDYDLEESVTDYSSQMETAGEEDAEEDGAVIVAEAEEQQEEAGETVPETDAAPAPKPEEAQTESETRTATTEVSEPPTVDVLVKTTSAEDVEEAVPDDETFRQVDEVAQRITKEVGAIAEDAVHEAQEYVSSVTQSIAPQLQDIGSAFSSWWSSIDSTLSQDVRVPDVDPSSAEPKPPEASAARLSSDLQALFPGLEKNENLIEKFPAKLLQTYTCAHNTYTPDIQMAFQGTLYITDKHTCFNVEENDRRLPIVLEHKQVERVERQRPTRRSEKNDILRINTGESGFIAMKDFSPGHLDSALALLEHLCEKVHSDEK
eukprot:1196226-Prorocentrum_minimum.AAC.1